ncbi:MAG: hypothetical protein Q9221_004992 [Calogaya cf. arnoldii]
MTVSSQAGEAIILSKTLWDFAMLQANMQHGNVVRLPLLDRYDISSTRAVTISNGHVFFMSGAYKIVGPDGNMSEWRQEKSLFALDLTKPFPVEDLISTDVLQNISVPLGLMPDIEDQTAASWSGALFPTNESLYIYGSGSSSLFRVTDPASATLNTLVRYDSTEEQWSSAFVAGGDFNHDARLWGQVATDPVNGTSFFTGGANNVRGMLAFHASDPTQVSWTNCTQVGDISDSNPHVIAGGMVFLPVGTSGALLLLGGANVRAVVRL